MGIISWIIFGALVGWVASLLTGQNERYGCLSNIIIGIVGALVGGLLMAAIVGVTPNGFTGQHFLVALLGAVVLLTISSWWTHRQSTV